MPSDNSKVSCVKPATSYTCSTLQGAVKLRLGDAGISATTPKTVPQIFRECCESYAHLPALGYDAGADNWTVISYAAYQRNVEQTALLLIHVGLQPHTSVGILAHNCPEWFYAELGAMQAGGVVAGIYTTSSPEAVLHALQTAEATVCVVDDATQLAKVRAVRSQLPQLKAVIQLHGPYEDYVGVEEGYYRWTDLMALQFEEALRDELKRRERNIGANECAMLVFTSGTTGMPKAAMLSHDSLIMGAKCCHATVGVFSRGSEVAISYLPLNHIAGQMFELFVTLENGDCIYFADRDALKGTLLQTLLKVRPTRVFGVPRVFEKLQERIAQIESESSSTARYNMNWAREVMVDCYMNNEKVGTPPNDLKYRLVSNIVRELRIALGLERCKSLIAGGAPLSLESKQIFMSIDLPLYDMYGLTETSGGISYTPDYRDTKSVGKAHQGTEICIEKLNNEGYGEVCVRGRCIMMGYLHEAEKTAEVIDAAGWFHTGDLGYLTEQDTLVLTGRLKELIITAGGENIPPVRIEEQVKHELPCISNAMLIGDKRKYLTMLLTLKTEMDAETGEPLDILQPVTTTWLQQLGLNYTRLSEVLKTPADLRDIDAAHIEMEPDQCVLDAIQAGLERVNENAISHAQRVQKFTLLPHDFSMPTGELGRTLKLRRPIVAQKYAHLIGKMYD